MVCGSYKKNSRGSGSVPPCLTLSVCVHAHTPHTDQSCLTRRDHLAQGAVSGDLDAAAVVGAGSALHEAVDGVELAANLYFWGGGSRCGEEQESGKERHGVREGGVSAL